jgi:23S rRNA U2552 (ribose-2'-O)-methylase RlmE/FtsJ
MPKKSSKKSSRILKREESTSENKEEKIIINSEYIPIYNDLIEPEVNIFTKNNDVKFSTNIDYPRFAFGFQHFIHQSKDKMEILKDFEGKKKVYQVLNQFERYIDNYDEDIGKTSKQYFGLGKDKPDILSRGFYKLWEILMLYNLIDVNNKSFTSAHLAEGPGSFIQATMFFREKFSKYWKDDQYYAVTLHPEDEGKHVPELERTFVNFYAKEKPQRFMLHKTYPKQVAGGSEDKDNGDITDPKTIILFGGDMKEKADFITADGGFEWGNENIQEQEAFRLIFGQIVGAIMNQKKGGHFVCKFFETFTLTSIKFLTILKMFWNKVEVIKPLTSRPSNSEKYYVCMDFKYNDSDKEFKDFSKKLLVILKEIHGEQKFKIVDIFSDYFPDDKFLKNIIDLNVKIENEQFKAINQIVAFIKAQNFYGDTYQMNRQKQINAAKFWISHFFPKDDELEKSRYALKKYFSFDK